MKASDDRPEQIESRPIPDPTTLTDKAIADNEKLMTLYIDGKIEMLLARMTAASEATKLFREDVIDERQRIHEITNEKIEHLSDLTTQRFAGVDASFTERDKLAQRESLLNKVALDAAFKAQQDAVTAQDSANQKAIDKSELATAKTIETNLTLTRATTDALAKAMDEVKTRVTAMESIKQGSQEQTTEHRQSNSSMFGWIAAATGFVLFIITIIAFIIEIVQRSPSS
jgi:hypothetical protein